MKNERERVERGEREVNKKIKERNEKRESCFFFFRPFILSVLLYN